MWLPNLVLHSAADGAVILLHLGLAAPFWPQRTVFPKGIPARKFCLKKKKNKPRRTPLLEALPVSFNFFTLPYPLCVYKNWIGVLKTSEQEMATHSSVLARRVLWMEEPGGLLFVGSHRVRHD